MLGDAGDWLAILTIDHVICTLHDALRRWRLEGNPNPRFLRITWFALCTVICTVGLLVRCAIALFLRCTVHGGAFLAIWDDFGRFGMIFVIGAMCEVRLHRVTRGHAWWCMVVVLDVFAFCTVFARDPGLALRCVCCHSICHPWLRVFVLLVKFSIFSCNYCLSYDTNYTIL